VEAPAPRASRRESAPREPALSPAELRQALEGFKARLSTHSGWSDLEWLALLCEVRDLVDRVEREGGDPGLLRELRGLREVLTQGLSTGSPADAGDLAQRTLNALGACLGKLPVGRGESFWF